MRHRLLFVFGTRPEAIKLAPLILRAAKDEKFQPLICVTSQHKEMLHQVLNVFDIIPDYDLDIMRPSQDLFDITTAVLQGMKSILNKTKPDVVCVQGDTTTAMAASLAAFYSRIPVAHVEAGLRTWDLGSPFPEEANRILTSRIAQHHFCPTHAAKQNLIREGISEKWIQVTGNTVIDAIKIILSRHDTSDFSKWVEFFGAKLTTLLNEPPHEVILITGHRRESFGQGFRNICDGIARLARHYPHKLFVYPVHLNPNVQQPVSEILSNLDNVHLIRPLEYLPFVALMNRSKLILTDSGGIQEEAPTLGKPVLVMRDTTERLEAIEAGSAMLVGTESGSIFRNACELLEPNGRYEIMSKIANPFGDGTASQKILDSLDHFLREAV